MKEFLTIAWSFVFGLCIILFWRVFWEGTAEDSPSSIDQIRNIVRDTAIAFILFIGVFGLQQALLLLGYI
jgi:hypothetical protein